MRKPFVGLVALGLAVGILPMAMDPADAAPPPGDTEAVTPRHVDDELLNPLEVKRRALRAEAMEQVAKGEATPEQRGSSKVVKVGEVGEPAANGKKPPADDGHVDQYVELENTGTDRVFTLLVEFGDETHPDFPDVDTNPDVPGPTTFDGPQHNQIPQPAADDNSTIWQPDYSQAYFQDLYFGDDGETFKSYYEAQSSGRYSVDGEVSPWTKVQYNEARYGRSTGTPCADVVCDNVYNLVSDGMDQWYADRLAEGMSEADVNAELASFDAYDRYDFDHDGEFNEPDGYLDHLQIIHAGGDEADGDPVQGEDAIWSHRAFAFQSLEGLAGPGTNLAGGDEIGTSGIWAGDYTLQAENGGLSTIAHEYGHDLGLPDHYDTSGGDNGIDWWTLMAQSRLSGVGEPIGTRPGDLGSWDKYVLGWLDTTVVDAGDDATIDMGPHEYQSAKAQGLRVNLPDKFVSRDYGDPFAGTHMWWSGSGNDLRSSMVRDVDLSGTTAASLDLQARFEIEEGYDYLYIQYSTNGATWTALDGTLGGAPLPTDASGNPAITGSSAGAYVPVHVDLTPLAGQDVKLRLYYRTDGGVAPQGFFADDITVTADGTPVVTSGAEGPDDEGWTLNGFKQTTGLEEGFFEHYYLASNRTYQGFDKYLRTGPYQFGFLNTMPSFVEHFPYQTGLLVTYVDMSWNDNNTIEHPGEGLVLPVDAHPRPLKRPDGAYWRGRVQTYDAPFGLRPTDALTLHVNGKSSNIPSQKGNPEFDDTQSYYDKHIPLRGPILPGLGVQMTVLSQNGTSMLVRVH
jgi:immune inhibitor A